MTTFFLAGAITLALGVIMPLAFFTIRTGVQQHRQQLIIHLASIFNFQLPTERSLFPSFDSVKYKYFSEGVTAEERRGHRYGIIKFFNDFSNWIVGVFQFFVVVALVIFFFFDWMGYQGFVDPMSNSIIWKNSTLILWHVDTILPLSVISAFLGAYITGLSDLYRDVMNFLLSPVSFLNFSKNIIRSVVLSGFIVLLPAKAITLVDSQLTFLPLAAAVLLSFAFGLYPGVAERLLVQQSNLKFWKSQDNTIFTAAVSVPVEIIDGIDSAIRERLENFYIFSVQNLAGANPIQLYVETPFGIYQLMDWVAQAQLCGSVGAKSVVKLWQLGIRTIFDLERAIDKNGRGFSPALIERIGSIILEGKTENEAVIANIELRLNDPYIHRLRQIYTFVEARLGSDALRLQTLLKPADQPKDPNGAAGAIVQATDANAEDMRNRVRVAEEGLHDGVETNAAAHFDVIGGDGDLDHTQSERRD